MKQTQEEKQWMADYFNIPIEETISFNSGNCFATAIVRTEQSANKIAEKVKDKVVNGGNYDGMKLGRISPIKLNEELFYSVMC